MTWETALQIYLYGLPFALILILRAAWAGFRDEWPTGATSREMALLVVGTFTLLWPVAFPIVALLKAWDWFCDAAIRAGGRKP